MGQYDLFRKIAQSTLTTKQRTVSQMQNDIINDFKSSPSYESVTISNVSRDVQIVDESYISKSESKKRILGIPNEIFGIGEIVVWNSANWIITGIDSNKEIQFKGTIQKSNNTLKFYHENSILYEIPCIVGKGNLGLDENKFLSLPADENYITCADTTDSSKIDENIRFILGKKVYSILGISDIVTPGLLSIHIKEGQFNADDNRDLGIANYFSHQSVKEIYILNGTEVSLLYTNATLQLAIQAKENGVIVSNPVVTYTTSSAYVATVSSTGLITALGTGDAIVTCYYGAVSASITIHSEMVVSDNYNIVISPTDTTLKLSRSLVLTAKAMDNGILDESKHFVWSISNLDGSSGNYATLTVDVVDDGICTVLASSLSSVANKYVVVRCSLSIDANVYFERTIKIINLF